MEIKEKKQTKNDLRLVAAAPELKDRWLDQINSGQYLPMANGKYEVSRAIGQQLEIQAGDLPGVAIEASRRIAA